MATPRSCRRSSVGIYKIEIFFARAIPPRNGTADRASASTDHPHPEHPSARPLMDHGCDIVMHCTARARVHVIAHCCRACSPQRLVECGFARDVGARPRRTRRVAHAPRSRVACARASRSRRRAEGATGVPAAVRRVWRPAPPKGTNGQNLSPVSGRRPWVAPVGHPYSRRPSNRNSHARSRENFSRRRYGSRRATDAVGRFT